MVVNKIRGFTLIELTIAFAIIAIMVVIVIGTLNPILLYERAIDDRRKKDLNYIRLAFEDYYTDKGCYPDAAFVSGTLMNPANCGRPIATMPQASQWPCDPISKKPYYISVPSGCPKRFKIFTRLANLSDNPISKTWLSQNRPYMFGYTGGVGTTTYSGAIINYGVANYGEDWQVPVGVSPSCSAGTCSLRIGAGGCNSSGSCSTAGATTCYKGSGCATGCEIASCP